MAFMNIAVIINNTQSVASASNSRMLAPHHCLQLQTTGVRKPASRISTTQPNPTIQNAINNFT